MIEEEEELEDLNDIELIDEVSDSDSSSSSETYRRKNRLPFLVKVLFSKRKQKSNALILSQKDDSRGHWETRFTFVLACVCSVLGVGNVVSFPIKVYRGGGGVFLVPYVLSCILFGCPVMILEMSLGQFCGKGCSKVFEFCPILSGLGWTMSIVAFIILASYSITISWFLLYMVSSFRNTLPWTICTNSFNTINCIKYTFDKNYTNLSSYQSSAVQFWNIYVTGVERTDGSYFKITDKLGVPNLLNVFCIMAVLGAGGGATMMGIKVTGKLMYLTIIFPYISLMQFIILGCSLPGAFKGIKFYLLPDPSKLSDPMIYFSAFKQVFFSLGLCTGCIMLVSSYSGFKNNVYQIAMIVTVVDLITSVIAGFATFPVLGYMSFISGKEIKDLLEGEENLIFTIMLEALSTLSNPNLWTCLLMFMLVSLGIDNIFIFVDVVVMSILDYWSILNTRKNKSLMTIAVCLTALIFDVVLITPGTMHWVALYESNVEGIILSFIVIMEVFTVCGIYGTKMFQHDIELMSGEKLKRFWLLCICTSVPGFGILLMVISFLLNKPLKRNGNLFPNWTQVVALLLGIIVVSPIFIKAISVLVKFRIRNWKLTFMEYMKLCCSPPVSWGPRAKLFWIQSRFYSEKLLIVRDNPQFVASLEKEDNMEILIRKAEKKLGIFKP